MSGVLRTSSGHAVTPSAANASTICCRRSWSNVGHFVAGAASAIPCPTAKAPVKATVAHNFFITRSRVRPCLRQNVSLPQSRGYGHLSRQASRTVGAFRVRASAHLLRRSNVQFGDQTVTGPASRSDLERKLSAEDLDPRPGPAAREIHGRGRHWGTSPLARASAVPAAPIEASRRARVGPPRLLPLGITSEHVCLR